MLFFGHQAVHKKARPMSTHKSSYVHPPYKTKYRIKNWAEYEKVGMIIPSGPT